MAAQGVAVLLSWLSCYGLALWRYSTNTPNHHIFSTRSTIKLEYEGTLFSEWSVPETCSVKNKSSPKTELRCSSGFHTIRPIVTGPDLEEERYLSVESSHICFLWYYKVINFVHNLTQVIIIWVFDPEKADPDELQWNANEPSLNSIILSKQFATLGQKPVIYTFLRKKVYLPHRNMKDGTWTISIPMTTDDAIKEIKGNKVSFQDCFISDFLLLMTFPTLTIPEVPGFLPISSPLGSQLMSDWKTCVPSSAIVVADMETFQTNDSFRTWTRIRVPPNILTDDERHSVSDVTLSQDGIFFLIKGILYVKSFTAFTKLGSNVNLPEGEIIGITSRKWCWIKYLLKDNKTRSSMAIWTKNEVYLGYTSPKFVKIITTEKLGEILNISPAATLTIHNVDYTGHPLELALLLNYCITCDVVKKIYLVIYNEDTKQWMHKDFVLDVTNDSFIIPYFLYSAVPELILWDKHRIYYCYHNFTDTGVLQTPTEFGNLSKLSHDSIIHNVFIDYYGNILVKMENNIMFYFKINIRDAVKLHLWTNSKTKSVILLNTFSQVYLVYVFENGTVLPQEYPLNQEAQSVAFKTKEKCPFMTFHHNISHFYILDKGQNLSVWVQIVYPENVGLYIILDLYGPKILEEKDQIHYEIALGYCTKNMMLTFFQNVNYEAVDDYFQLQHQNTGLLLVQVRPSEYTKTCPTGPKVFQVAVGCDTSKFIAVKGSYLRDRPSKNLMFSTKGGAIDIEKMTIRSNASTHRNCRLATNLRRSPEGPPRRTFNYTLEGQGKSVWFFPGPHHISLFYFDNERIYQTYPV